MAFELGEHLPQDFEELEELATTVYQQGVDAGRIKERAAVKDFLNKEILAAKGNNRRPDPNDPKVQAIREITERLYAAFQDGTL